jgi:uncharacterized coiled-coil protein SlyX
MNSRDVIAQQAATMERLKDQVAVLQEELDHAYAALTRAAAESWIGRRP